MNEFTGIGNRQVAKLQVGNPVNAIVPQTIDEVFRLAQLINASGLAPRDLNSPEKVTIVLLKGLEIGMPPMAAMESFGVINGKACIYGDGIPALLWSRGFDIEETFEGEGDSIKAVCTITRPNGKQVTRKFEYKDAVTAQLAGKDLYKKFPQRMYPMRARGWAARDGAADILKGIKVFEEQADIDLDRSEVRDITPSELPMPPPIVDQSSSDDDVLADAAGFLAKLKEERSFCQSDDDVAELRESNAEMLARLSADDQARAMSIIDGDAE